MSFNVHNMVKHMLKISQHLLQDFQRTFGHFEVTRRYGVRDHSFGTYAKFFKKTNIFYPLNLQIFCSVT